MVKEKNRTYIWYSRKRTLGECRIREDKGECKRKWELWKEFKIRERVEYTAIRLLRNRVPTLKKVSQERNVIGSGADHGSTLIQGMTLGRKNQGEDQRQDSDSVLELGKCYGGLTFRVGSSIRITELVFRLYLVATRDSETDISSKT